MKNTPADVLSPFPCNACGQCCRHVYQSKHTAYLDRGDGICRHFNESTKLCQIYAERPLVCRVADYYLTHLTDKMTWHHFVQLNKIICQQWQQESSE